MVEQVCGGVNPPSFKALDGLMGGERIVREDYVGGAIAKLRSSDPAQRISAMDILANPREKDERVKPALISALSDKNEYVRNKAVDALGMMEDPEAEKALFSRLFDSNINFVRKIAGTLGAAKLIETLSSRDPNKKIASARALGLLGDRESIQPLLDSLGDADPSFARECAKSLMLLDKNMKESGVVPGLIQKLSDKDPNVRALAAESLGSMAEASSVPALINLLSDKEPFVCKVAIHALGDIRDRRAVNYLVLRLLYPDPDIRGEAALALGKIGDGKAVPALLGRLMDDNPDVRAMSATSLGNIGDRKAIQPLRDLLIIEKNDFVADAARLAITDIESNSEAVPRKIQ